MTERPFIPTAASVSAVNLTVLLFSLTTPHSLHAFPLRPLFKGGSKVADEIIEIAARVSKRQADDAARKTLQPAVERGIRLYGDDAVRAAARRGGLEILEASTKYGDDVLRLAKEVPEATRVLAVRADELVPLAERLGSDVLRVEAVRPGLARAIVREIPAPYTRDVLKYGVRHPDDALTLTSIAAHLPDPNLRIHLIRTFEKTRNKAGFLEVLLEKVNWKTIMAGGISAAFITSARKIADGIDDPAAAERVATRFVDWVGGTMALIAASLFLFLAAPVLGMGMMGVRPVSAAIKCAARHPLAAGALAVFTTAAVYLVFKYSLKTAAVFIASALIASGIAALYPAGRKRKQARPKAAAFASSQTPPAT